MWLQPCQLQSVEDLRWQCVAASALSSLLEQTKVLERPDHKTCIWVCKLHQHYEVMAAFFSCFQILTLTSFAYSLKLRREKFPHVKVIFQSVLNRDIQYVSPKEVVKRYLPPCYCTFNYNNYKTIIVCSKKNYWWNIWHIWKKTLHLLL